MSISTLFEHLSHDAIIITANQRLERRLAQTYAQEKMEAGYKAWESPAIYAWSSWTHSLYQSALNHGKVFANILSPLQEKHIWQKIIRAAMTPEKLASSSECAKLAIQAWGILKKWRVSYELQEFNWQSDTQLFSEWAVTYAQYCQKRSCIDKASIIDILAELPREHWLKPTINTLIFVGFDEITPQTAYFIEELEKQGINCLHKNWEIASQKPSTHVYMTHQQEIYAMAHWAYQEWKNEKTHIACIFPELANQRALVSRIFHEVFYPNTLFYTLPPGHQLNISGGEPLASFALIQIVFDLLKLVQKDSHYSLISRIICSPFVGERESDAYLRAELDEAWRKRMGFHTSLSACLDTHLELQERVPDLQNRLQQFVLLQHTTPDEGLPSEWLFFINRVLTIMGWPGPRVVNSLEFQLLGQWQELLAEVAKLDIIEGKISFKTFSSLLYDAANHHVFQAKTPNAPVQILGILEASGSVFDSIWIAGLNDQAWPPAATPNPFIPMTLQHQHQMPHANSERQSNYSEQLMQRFLHAAENVQFSYAAWEADRALAPSPLLQAYADIFMYETHYEWPILHQIFQTKITEPLLEKYQLVLSEQEKVRSYSSALLEQQANCPFQAFAMQRLQATVLEWPTPGIDVRKRGKLTHDVLEKLWDTWQNSEKLKSLDETQLQNQMLDASAHAIFKLFSSDEMKRHPQLIDLEKERLLVLLQQWFSIEKNRADFNIFSLEQKQVCNLGGLTFSLRIDRIDQTSNGEWILVDYKTGRVDLKEWYGTPPSKPQLLLYAIAFPKPLSAIAFGQMRPGDVGFVGVSDDSELLLPSLKPFNASTFKTTATSWSEQLSQWQLALENLVQQFIQGDARVEPLHRQKSCAHCHLATLCRINSQGNTQDE